MAALRAAMLAAAFFLAGCNATGTTPAAFLLGFEPSAQRIHGYDAVAAVPYVARLASADLETVNNAVNDVPYRADERREWIAPRDFWQRGGDCEDYAMTKAAELKAAGRQGLWLAVLTDGPHGEAHAVLAVEEGGKVVALDNRASRPVAWASLAAEYRPAYIIDIETGKVFRRKSGRRSKPSSKRCVSVIAAGAHPPHPRGIFEQGRERRFRTEWRRPARGHAHAYALREYAAIRSFPGSEALVPRA